ncbi:GNAT family N-acetyltransferase [Luteimonas sp. SX5]|uniref:GNAT family N-acetyltransferase n=1 Tax=Luteimonas galliterrae TaxID=2940486 RepID=A0ABT0MLJ9_9GAMM|nr:GNAT family N-acetyltransferase [Luteimonas galliterrae]MCL1635752.1 GNAT family N-acetyltransferase [Luteimonas galliterrae]
MAGASETIGIRRCGAGDAERLALVAAATFLETYAGVIECDDILAHCAHQNAPGRYAAWLADERHVFWLAEAQSGGAPVGFSMLSPPDLPSVATYDGDLELKRIYLLHRFHGGGHGATLMQAAIGEARARGARRLLLGVYAENARALAFYKRNGFVPIGERRFRVGGAEYHDLVLALDLIAS